MEISERAARHLLRQLADDERLLASVVGREVREGWARRRVAVAATDRRLLFVWLRPAPRVVAVPYAEVVDLQVARDGTAERLTVVTATDRHVVQAIVDGSRLRLLTDLVRGQGA